jgi:hypothetical protein
MIIPTYIFIKTPEIPENTEILKISGTPIF